MNPEWFNALVGGALIGLSVSLMLLLNGRVTGISGIINGLLSPVRGDALWRVFFVMGLLLGGLVVEFFDSTVFESQVFSSVFVTVIAGVLVGFGTVMGSGCTSGHGVCGISRMSPRSILATLTFISAGVATVTLLKKFGFFL